MAFLSGVHAALIVTILNYVETLKALNDLLSVSVPFFWVRAIVISVLTSTHQYYNCHALLSVHVASLSLARALSRALSLSPSRLAVHYMYHCPSGAHIHPRVYLQPCLSSGGQYHWLLTFTLTPYGVAWLPYMPPPTPPPPPSTDQEKFSADPDTPPATVAALTRKCDLIYNVRCAFSDRNLHARMPLDPTHVRLKQTCV
jgi:hypothetical protein